MRKARRRPHRLPDWPSQHGSHCILFGGSLNPTSPTFHLPPQHPLSSPCGRVVIQRFTIFSLFQDLHFCSFSTSSSTNIYLFPRYWAAVALSFTRLQDIISPRHLIIYDRCRCSTPSSTKINHFARYRADLPVPSLAYKTHHLASTFKNSSPFGVIRSDLIRPNRTNSLAHSLPISSSLWGYEDFLTCIASHCWEAIISLCLSAIADSTVIWPARCINTVTKLR